MWDPKGATGTRRFVVGALELMVVAGARCFCSMGPSHVGVQGKERADEVAVRELVRAFRQIKNSKEVEDIWQELGLEEIFSEDNLSGGRVTGQ